MSDTSNQIIQTLEAIHGDIRSAKDALKENNVTLESNTTATLTSEINKIPTAIKSADKLVGFNDGKSSLAYGFIFPVDETECNINNTAIIECDEYIFPENKTFKMNFPTTNLIDKYYNDSPQKEFRVFAKGVGIAYDLYRNMLKPMYDTYINNILTDMKLYKLNIILDGNVVMDGHVYGEFVFPNLNTDFYIKSPSSETETLVTTFNINKFHFSLPYRGKDITINCNELVIELDTFRRIMDTVGHNYGAYFKSDEFYNRRDDQDAFIINLPEFNVSYETFFTDPRFASFAENVYGDNTIPIAETNIQIRINETPDNLTKLDQDIHKVNILRFMRIYNQDGTKVYDPNSKTFVDKDTYITEQDLNVTMTNKAKFFEDNTLGFFVTSNDTRPVDYKKYTKAKNEERANVLKSLTIKPGYAFFNAGLGGLVQPAQFRFDDYNQPEVFNGFPMFGIAEGVLQINRNSRAENSGKLIGTNKLKFEFADILDATNSSILPAIKMCAELGNGFTYNGLEFKITGHQYTETDGSITYYGLSNASNLLVSPYNAEFKASDDSLITNIVSNNAPMVYNKNIKNLKIKSETNSPGRLQSILGFNNVYQSADSMYDKPAIPEKPMNIILDNNSSIVVSQSPTYYSIVSGYTYVLGPYSTDEMAKYYDKFIHVCVDENHPKLGTYEFCKFRMPLYNLDNTKKYNYSNKTWEPVGSLTDDSKSIQEIFPTESATENIMVVYNQGYELN